MDSMDITPTFIAIYTIPSLVVGLLLYHQIRRVHDTFNSKMDKLLLLTDTEAFARGVLQGKVEGEGRLDDAFESRVDKIVNNAHDSGYQQGIASRPPRG